MTCIFKLKMMNFVLKTMNFEFKMTDFGAARPFTPSSSASRKMALFLTPARGTARVLCDFRLSSDCLPTVYRLFCD